ncbi:hypothetical protein VTP01DRAFT_3250 [Rhizomucor pusillus]|uniref:uncharacterized protein n=1 Tax=Rhizomucor pusillus TaxID=4840 RepID=UPI0037432907
MLFTTSPLRTTSMPGNETEQRQGTQGQTEGTNVGAHTGITSSMKHHTYRMNPKDFCWSRTPQLTISHCVQARRQRRLFMKGNGYHAEGRHIIKRLPAQAMQRTLNTRPSTK